MTETTASLADLLDILYNAHRGLNAMALEIRDTSVPQAGGGLIVSREPSGGTRVRWAQGGGPSRSHTSIRRVWFELPARVRVEVLQDTKMVSEAVRDGTAWWQWDAELGETTGDLANGSKLPPALDLALLNPARLMHGVWFELIGRGERAGREVLMAHASPRESSLEARRQAEFRFEFDRVHGTPLHVMTKVAGQAVRTSETLSVEYDLAIAPTIFAFERGVTEPLPGADENREPSVPAVATTPPTDRRVAVVSPKTVWLTGLSGAGKTTIAEATAALVRRIGATCCVLDGDVLRRGLSSDLAMTASDRHEQARRAAHIAVLLADAGIVPIVALVSPYREDRRRARAIHREAGIDFIEVWVDTPLAVCEARDPKGLYARARASRAADTGAAVGGLIRLTGVSSSAPYEPPTQADMRVSGAAEHPRIVASAILERLLSDRTGTSVVIVD